MATSAAGKDASSSFTGIVLSRFAQKAPALKKTGNKHKDDRRELERAAFMQVVSMLEQDMSRCPLLLTQLQTDDKANAQDMGDDESMWPSTYHQLYRLPKYYKGMLLTMAGTKLTDDHIEAINMQDHEAIDLAFYLLSQTKDTTPLPRECLDKEVCVEFFRQRFLAVGSRIDAWVGKALRTDGTIDWVGGMAYELRFDGEEVLVEVLHRFSGDVAPVPSEPPVKISTNYIVEHPEDEMTTCLKVGRFLTITFSTLFGPGAGPNKHHIVLPKNPNKRTKAVVPFFEMAVAAKETILKQRAAAEKEAQALVQVSVKKSLQKGDDHRAQDRLKKLEAARSKIQKKRPLQITINRPVTPAAVEPAPIPDA